MIALSRWATLTICCLKWASSIIRSLLQPPWNKPPHTAPLALMLLHFVKIKISWNLQWVWNWLIVCSAGLYILCLFCTDNSWPPLSSIVNDMLYFLFGVDMLPWVSCGLVIYWLPFHHRFTAFTLKQTYCEMRAAFAIEMLQNLANPVFLVSKFYFNHNIL